MIVSIVSFAFALSLVANIAISAPSFASLIAQAAPIPLEPPVTIAVLSVNI